MINTTVHRLECPRRRRQNRVCGGSFSLVHSKTGKEKAAAFEVEFGTLKCGECSSQFPILAGVAVLVDDVRSYLLNHVKGISRLVSDHEIPAEYRRDFLEARAEIQVEHFEEDLEAQRVNALYLMNHYLRVRDVDQGLQNAWWKDQTGSGSPLFDSLIRSDWDQGVFAKIGEWSHQFASKEGWKDVVELGCGVGGLFSVLKNQIRSYLGTDSSFASIALARHIVLGTRYRGAIQIPGDLLNGPVSRPFLGGQKSKSTTFEDKVDFIVSEFENCPLKKNQFDVAIALNAIDMLDVPSRLPELQYALLKSKGFGIQSGPYIWHEKVAKKLRAKAPPTRKDSASVVEWLYEQVGFQIEAQVDHIPWLFFKHLRQLEIYSVHLFLGLAKK